MHFTPFYELDVSYASQHKSVTVKIWGSYLYRINGVWNLDRKAPTVEI